jgi:hypothetical protein
MEICHKLRKAHDGGLQKIDHGIIVAYVEGDVNQARSTGQSLICGPCAGLAAILAVQPA